MQRDIDYLRYQLDAPIEYSARQRGYYYTEERFQLPAMDIRESDLFGVYLAEKLLVQYEGTPVYESLCSLFGKIEQSLPDKVSTSPAAEQAKFTVIPPSSTSINPAIWETVIGALRLSQQVAIRYRTPGKEPVTRELDPYHAVRFEGEWYIVGYCHLRGEIRTFGLSRILSAEKTGREFAIPPDFDFQKYSGNHFGVHWSDGETTVKVLFRQRVADYILERNWHPSQEVERCANGELILSLKVNHLLELKRWILSWGADAKVLKPESFVEEVRATLNAGFEQY